MLSPRLNLGSGCVPGPPFGVSVERLIMSPSITSLSTPLIRTWLLDLQLESRVLRSLRRFVPGTIACVTCCDAFRLPKLFTNCALAKSLDPLKAVSTNPNTAIATIFFARECVVFFIRFFICLLFIVYPILAYFSISFTSNLILSAMFGIVGAHTGQVLTSTWAISSVCWRRKSFAASMRSPSI